MSPYLLISISILAGLLDYLICDLVAWINHLPLFCDTIFIMAISFLAGPWWGILASFAYHIFDFALTRFVQLGHLYILCHFLAALTAGYFKMWFIKKTDSSPAIFLKLIVLSITLCLIMSISGGIINFILNNIDAYNEASSQTDFLTFLWENKFESKLLLLIAVRIPINIADRLISVFAAWGIYVLFKKNYKASSYKSVSSS